MNTSSRALLQHMPSGSSTEQLAVLLELEVVGRMERDTRGMYSTPESEIFSGPSSLSGAVLFPHTCPSLEPSAASNKHHCTAPPEASAPEAVRPSQVELEVAAGAVGVTAWEPPPSVH